MLWKAARAVQAYAEKSVSELEMCGSDFAVLEALLHKGPLPVNEIGKKVLLTSGSITVAVDRLEMKGFVERRTHGTDRRAKIVHLTKKGRKLITGAYADHAADLERLASASLTRAERKTLIRLLKKIGYEAAGALKQGEEEEYGVSVFGVCWARQIGKIGNVMSMVSRVLRNEEDPRGGTLDAQGRRRRWRWVQRHPCQPNSACSFSKGGEEMKLIENYKRAIENSDEELSPASIQTRPRKIVHRTRGSRHGPITRLMSPGDLGEVLKPFVFLDLFDMEKASFSGIGLHPHSGIATVTYLFEGSVRYEDTSWSDRNLAGRRRGMVQGRSRRLARRGTRRHRPYPWFPALAGFAA